jgi:hypothetical protein
MKSLRCFLIQDVETYQFLREGDSGDVDFTPFVDCAGVFHSQEVANEAGQEHCGGEGYILFPFCKISSECIDLH